MSKTKLFMWMHMTRMRFTFIWENTFAEWRQMLWWRWLRPRLGMGNGSTSLGGEINFVVYGTLNFIDFFVHWKKNLPPNAMSKSNVQSPNRLDWIGLYLLNANGTHNSFDYLDFFLVESSPTWEQGYGTLEFQVQPKIYPRQLGTAHDLTHMTSFAWPHSFRTSIT